MKKILISIFVLILTSCNTNSEVAYEIKFIDGAVIHVTGFDCYMSKKQGVVEIWTNTGDHFFNYDYVLSVIKQN